MTDYVLTIRFACETKEFYPAIAKVMRQMSAWLEVSQWRDRLHSQQMRVIKALLLIAALYVLFAISAAAQCTTQPGYVCITQDAANDMAAKLDELKASRDVIAKFQAERTATDAERQAATVLLKAANDALDTLSKGIADREKLIDLQQKTLTLYADLVQKLTDKLNKPKSAFSKFMTALKEIALLAAGIALGRGGL